MKLMSTESTGKKRGPSEMTDEHKAALALGRNESRTVKNYLEALVATKPKRGRKRTPESIGNRLEAIDDAIDGASPITKLQLVQERMDLEAELEAMGQEIDISGLESEFIQGAKAYGQRKGISYAAWRELDVSAAVLKSAGISRGS